MTARSELAGQRFVRLLVLERFDDSRLWLCVCDCGALVVTSTNNLNSNNTKSCGCLRRDVSAASLRALTFRHGLGRTRSYGTWSNMIGRCFKKKNHKYPDYGGRGITVCDRWLDFTAFYDDMGERPKGMTIERIDNGGNYEPDNCRWATPKEQANNTRRNRRITFNGETLNLTAWAERLGVTYGVLHWRLLTMPLGAALSQAKGQ